MAHELETFLAIWDGEARKTADLMRALPEDSYDFRPDAGGRSVGELAWHLAEGDAYNSLGVEQRGFDRGELRPPGIERPRTIAALASGYERIHAEAAARLRRLAAEDLSARVRYFDGKERPISDVLWSGILFHHIHHRGQLSCLCRMAGGVSPGMYGPNREEMKAMRAQAGQAQQQEKQPPATQVTA
jgi:uncharacterized damage-inducible protein DinB